MAMNNFQQDKTNNYHTKPWNRKVRSLGASKITSHLEYSSFSALQLYSLIFLIL